MAEVKKRTYKYCIVPMCKSTTFKSPNNFFFHVRKDINTRKKWCKLMRRDLIGPKSTTYVCEDHFDARFPQKQMQEREMKIASLYEAQQARALDRVRHSPSSVPSPPPPAPAPAPIAHQPGKVRQMFEERRTKGIDKSYPLQPIHNTDRNATRKALPNGYSKVTSSVTSSKPSEKKTTARTKVTTSLHNVKKKTTPVVNNKVEKVLNGSGDVNHNHVQNLNPSANSTAQTNGVEKHKPTEADEVDNNYLLENETFPEAMAPIPTPRSPEKRSAPQRPPRKSPSVTSPVKTKPQDAPTPPQRKPSSSTSNKQGAQGAMQQQSSRISATSKAPSLQRAGLSSARSGKSATEETAGAACAVCGRRFAADRLPTHENICRKAHAKKRKPFDALKHRLAGTEAEPFIGKLRKGATSTTKVTKPMNSTWRQKHEDFVKAIRAAKQVQAHLNAGGKLSDLPPPPPSENPDYVQCPHCGRRFNQQAADRHIPKCATYQFNKPSTTKKR